MNVRLRSKEGSHAIETHGGFLFTHRGYSGPSVLDISHVTARGESPSIRVQWAPLTADDLMAGDSVAAVLSRHVPGRLAEQLMIECGVPLDRRISSLKRTERVALIDAVTSYPLAVEWK